MTDDDDELPRDPTVLSYLVAATMVLDLADHQALLAAPDTATRLRLELDLLRRESALLRAAAEPARRRVHPPARSAQLSGESAVAVSRGVGTPATWR